MSEPALPGESVEDYRDAIRAGNRRAIARAITLIESTRPEHSALGQAILEALVPYTGRAQRVGITGPPGVGKSTLIEVLGLHGLEQGKRLAVLAVDPSSPVTGGSILGDKTRMERLATSADAFIRPSPSGGALGGVAHRTREVMLLCEAAGYNVVLIETVGIGQSEVAVASMVDFFLVLLLPGGGDELQGIKRGVMELADALVVNKADGDTRELAERTRLNYQAGLHLIRPSTASWRPRALLASAETGEGIDVIWQTIFDHRQALSASGELGARRRVQARDWMWSLLDEGLRQALDRDPAVVARVPELERDVQDLKTTPAAAARILLDLFLARGR
ncbi:MAG: methylmalonyl Co-A mutase-associated GTPase MeaB [Deltaproteobacteria bacterium]|nr:methylmalonyl Co-A mutase-associated GTPase MeaB [Deltaproteobacteria bacterium]MBW2385393.1 methylmalonyl Co-A mutase-associated GTPase MeaB [Deltaproteobacteria bacterium]